MTNTDGATTTVTTEQEAPAAQKAAGTPAPVKAEAAKPEPQQAKEPASPPTTPKMLKGDEEDLDAGELYQLNGAALKKRLERATRAQLRTEFGTDDFGEIKAKLQKLAEYEEQQEEARRAALAEEERLREDLERERDARVQMEQRLEREQTKRVINSEQRRIETLAAKHIDDDLRDDAISRFRKHLRKMSDNEINAFSERDIAGWFEKLAKEKPKFAREQPKPELPKVPVTNGARTDAKPPPPAFKSGGQSTEKTFRPGQPNSMTKDEIKKAGFSW